MPNSSVIFRNIAFAFGLYLSKKVTKIQMFYLFNRILSGIICNFALTSKRPSAATVDFSYDTELRHCLTSGKLVLLWHLETLNRDSMEYMHLDIT